MRKISQLGVGAASLGILIGLVVVPVAAPTPMLAQAVAAEPPPTIRIAATVRDFEHDPVVHADEAHPDFEHNSGDDREIVADRLGPDGTPAYRHPGGTTGTTHGEAAFAMWYHDAPGVNIAVPVNLDAVHVAGSDPPTYRYDDPHYFPVDGKGWNDPSFGSFPQTDLGGHNFSFTTEVHSEFVYQGGESFTFTGDDDLFLFLNGHLAINLGGVHDAETASVDLDAEAAALGLELGGTYSFDLFGAERHTSQSNFTFETSIRLLQTPEVTVTGVADGASYGLGAVPDAGCTATSARGEPVVPAPTPTVGEVTGDLAPYGLGTQTVTCTYTDEGGTGTARATYSIVTTQPPVLGSHDDLLVEIQPEEDVAVVDYALPSATDPHDLPVTVTCAPPPGSTFPVGVTPVTCTAVNVAGLRAASPVTFLLSVQRLPKLDTVLTAELLPRQLAARLTEAASGAPVAGQPIVFLDDRGNPVCTAVTDGDGLAVCPGFGVPVFLRGYTATFAGTARFNPSSSVGGLGAPTLTPTPPQGGLSPGKPPVIG